MTPEPSEYAWDVFLSYASEDREYVRTLRDALVAAGIPLPGLAPVLPPPSASRIRDRPEVRAYLRERNEAWKVKLNDAVESRSRVYPWMIELSGELGIPAVRKALLDHRALELRAIDGALFRPGGG